MTEQELLALRIELEALISEREGMVADNMQRQAVGSSMAWDGNAFDEIARKIRAIGTKP
jgi:hypothetical protein